MRPARRSSTALASALARVMVCVFFLCGMAMSLSAGCASTDRGPVVPPMPEDPQSWPYWPTSMRIHPLTRFTIDDETGELILEARIECSDRDGMVSRCWGQMRLVLRDGRVRDPQQSFVDSWQIDLADAATNAGHFDAITRTYLFRLALTPGDLPDQPRLEAHLTVEGAQGLDAAGGIRLPETR